MHTCLNVDEIIRLVASELVASRAEATAVALACCRKSFEDPVLDTLWETQESLLPLLRTLPRDVWVTGEEVSVPTIFVLSLLNSYFEVSQAAADGVRTGSFPEVRSKNATAQRTCRFDLPPSNCVLESTTSRHQRTITSESENSPVVAHH